jgi:MoaA/NifB/PqqE/SkfB family radical SAM enzyme
MENSDTGRAVPVRLAVRRPSQPVDLDGAPTACSAPTRNLQFLPDGSIRACSQNLWPLGNVRSDELGEVWNGDRRIELIDRLGHGDLSRGCETCGAEFLAVGRSNSFAGQFDRLADVGDPDWPARLEFSLSEECNLECVHCYGAIQELRRNVPDSSKFDDRFVEQLEPFLLHATEAVFGGGEPFVIEANYRVWERIAAVAPGLPCTIVTNGTHWTADIEALMDRLNVGFVVSIDGATAPTFEAIRVNASWSQVRDNLDRIRSHVTAHGTWMSINFVLMDQNHHELGLVAELADDLDAGLSVVLARHPDSCAIGRQGAQRRRTIAESLLHQRSVHPERLGRNSATFERAVTEALGVCDTHVDQQALVRDSHRILLFTRSGSGPVDDTRIRTELAALSSDGTVHEVRVGPGDLITETSRGVAAMEPDLVGQPAEHLQLVLNEVLGAPVEQQILAEDDDRLDVLTVHPQVDVRTSLVAVRDESGRADEVRILFCHVDRPA